MPILELDGFMPGTDLGQLPAMVERGKEMLDIFLGRLEPQLAGSEFIVCAPSDRKSRARGS